LVSAGASLIFANEDGFTALLLACFFGHIDIVAALLDAGADVNQVERKCNNALCYASGKGGVEVVQLLLARGANGIPQALAVATFKGHRAIVDILMTSCSMK